MLHRRTALGLIAIACLSIFAFNSCSKKDINAKDQQGRTALMLAAKKGDFNQVQKLIRKKAAVNVWDNRGWTPLMFAIPDTTIMNLLIQKQADINAMTRTQETPLMLAVVHGDIPAVELLLDNKANPDVQDQYGRTALYRAIVFGYTDIIQRLIEKNANVNLRTTAGETPLIVAVKNNDLDTVRTLIYKDADVNVKYGNTTALSIAKSNNATEIVKLLKAAGAK
ncbi:MAG: ankyrin repeat domain-containing protein [bacterium]